MCNAGDLKWRVGRVGWGVRAMAWWPHSLVLNSPNSLGCFLRIPRPGAGRWSQPGALTSRLDLCLVLALLQGHQNPEEDTCWTGTSQLTG